jgi:peptidoglycan/LPS O-acetylase OafA/YrhL
MFTIITSIIVICCALFFSPKDFFLLKTGILCVVYFFLVIAMCSFSFEQTKLFNNKIFIISGEISYSIYILQYPFFRFYTYYVTSIKTAYQLSIFVLLLVVLSCFSYYFIEIPLRKIILDKYYKRKNLKVTETIYSS